MAKTNTPTTLYVTTREEWRQWLENNFETAQEIWLVFPNKSAKKECLHYNEAVEEALAFGWIDSTIRKLDEHHRIHWFLPRKNKKNYSQPNRERLKWMWEQGLIHPSMMEEVESILKEEFIFPTDIIERLKQDKVVWENYQKFSDGYKRLRIAYIENARKYPEEFEKRFSNFINKTRQGKMIPGNGGLGKYY